MAGIHHVTAISGKATRNLNFYTQIIGLRLVKKTVNFDDPGTYHLYYGDQIGHPGQFSPFSRGSTHRRDVPAWVSRSKRRSGFQRARSDTGRIASLRKVSRIKRYKSALASQSYPSAIPTT